ncbi:MAG: chemotaxis protein CheB [Bdellovibrionota bacterium]|nr:chemotaxis protein CheB [Bdellovibrionota bacterium]
MNINLSHEEREMVFLLASQLTGTCQEGNFRHEILVTNVIRRMHKVNVEDLETYLEYVEEHSKEMPHLLSALTIHTTNWFREKPHYNNFVELLEKYHKEHPKQKFVMLSAACSTGEEVWSFALVCEWFRQKNPGFEFEVHGRDIDPVSVAKAKKCIYNASAMKDIPSEYQRNVLKGSGKTKGLFTMSKEIRNRCYFEARSLTDNIASTENKFNYVVVRNVLIYFSPEEVDGIIKRLLGSLVNDGILTVGHSEAIDYRKYNISLMGNSTYSKVLTEKDKERSSGASFRSRASVSKPSQSSSVTSTRPSANIKKSKYKVLVVDDSPTVRSMMCKMIDGLKFVPTPVESAKMADEALAKEDYDIITLDLHMPEKDGHEWLQEKRRKGLKIPVIIVSDANPAEAQQVLKALGDGAQDYIEKKNLGTQKQAIQDRLLALLENDEMVRQQSSQMKQVESSPEKVSVFQPEIIVLGASTGGTEALVRVLRNMPRNSPPVMVVQHISEDFAEAFAKRLAEVSGLKLASHESQELLPGHLYMSIKEEHIGVKKSGSKYVSYFEDSPRVSSHKPSVDFLFNSLSELPEVPALAILLTGMGKDGAQGLLKLKRNSVVTMCQDADSSVVWGMPGEATKIGAPVFLGDTTKIRQVIDRALMSSVKKSA